MGGSWQSPGGHTKHQASPSLQELRGDFVPDNYKCALGTRQAADELYPDTWRTEIRLSLQGWPKCRIWLVVSPRGAHHPSRQNQACLDLRQEGVDGGGSGRLTVTSRSLWASSLHRCRSWGCRWKRCHSSVAAACATCCSWPSFCEHRRGGTERREWVSPGARRSPDPQSTSRVLPPGASSSPIP